MPCKSCGGSGSSASSQFKLKRANFTPLKKRKSRIVYMTKSQIEFYKAQKMAIYKKRRTLLFA